MIARPVRVVKFRATVTARQRLGIPDLASEFIERVVDAQTNVLSAGAMGINGISGTSIKRRVLPGHWLSPSRTALNEGFPDLWEVLSYKSTEMIGILPDLPLSVMSTSQRQES